MSPSVWAAGDEPGFELAGGEHDSAVEHGAEESGVGGGVALECVGVVLDDVACPGGGGDGLSYGEEEGGDHGADALDGDCDSGLGGGVDEAGFEACAEGFQLGVEGGLFEE